VAMMVMLVWALVAESRSPFWLRNSAGSLAPGQPGRSPSQSLSTVRSGGWMGTSRSFSSLP
jgi:hypothetical protein